MVMREEEPPRTGLRGWLSDPEVRGWIRPRLVRLLESIAEALQEAGILILVFGLLDFNIKNDPGEDALWPMKVAKVGAPVLVGGILMKVLLLGDKKP
jgi:hypothetical protein